MLSFQHKISSTHKNLTLDFVTQNERKGTAHAVSCAVESFNNSKKLAKKVLILYGDTPLINHQTLNKMLEKLNNFSLCILGFEDEKPNSYGRLVIDENNHLNKIVEFKDANEIERKIALCNSGVIAVDGEILPKLLSQVDNKNSAQEFYLTDIVGIANQIGLKCTFIKTNTHEVLGLIREVNSQWSKKLSKNKSATK